MLIMFSLAENSRMRYPVLRFGGSILYSRTTKDVEKAATELLQCLKAKKNEAGQVSVGFDIEWKPSFRRGIMPGKAAVMQICCDTSFCHIMHIIHSGIPPSLQFLLEDSSISKVGVAVGGDAVKIFKDYNVPVKAVEDISYLANQKLGGGCQKWSLASLTEELVCKELQKSKKIRLGNWEVGILSQKQLEYAATDAFASWHLYQVINCQCIALDIEWFAITVLAIVAMQVLKNLPDVVNDATDEKEVKVPS
ncbi:hypothetical protein SLEP1_g37673 [Rubroshorea leprosula]|uniref:3'-5' exonuclease n=1 Tax=Rubroshorea leprosula TaxID=152421 RepID=A0AAV5KVL2_9ROSI|nr:hypothetical protein SLEP1_g37673 [Rubroshorea leprosula]